MRSMIWRFPLAEFDDFLLEIDQFLAARHQIEQLVAADLVLL